METLFQKYPVYKLILDAAIPHLINGRPYKLVHTIWGIEDALKILKGEGSENLISIVMPAFIFHDSRWDAVEGTNVDSTNWGSRKGRITHMREGAKFAREVLERLGYPDEQISQITHIISEHDNRYLDPSWKPDSQAATLHFGIDAAFIFSPYFWKDWYTKYSNMNPLKCLQQQAKKYQYNAFYPVTAQALIDRQTELRRAEIESGRRGGLGVYHGYFETTNELSRASIKMVEDGASPMDIMKRLDVLLTNGGLSRR